MRSLWCVVALVCAIPGCILSEALPPARVSRVLLISIDGLHALDLANYVQAKPDSTLAKLARHGVT